MPEHEGDDQPGRLRRVLTGATEWLLAKPSHVAYVVVIAALLLTVPFGGLAAAPEEQLPRLDPGESVTAAPWELSLDRAIYGPDLGGSFLDTGQTHVLLLGTLSTTADQTVRTTELDGSLQVDGIPDVRSSLGEPLEAGAVAALGAVFDTRPTPLQLRAVAPGLDYPVAIHLTTPAQTLPPEIEVTVSAKSYRQSSLDDTYLWTDATPSAVLVVPTQESGPIYPSVWELEQ